MIRSGPPQQPPPQQAGRPAAIGHATVSPLYAAKCPWCRRLHDLRGHAGQELGGVGEGSIGVEYGAIWYCEEKDSAGNVVAGCRRSFRITEIKQVTMVKLEPIQIQAPRR